MREMFSNLKQEFDRRVQRKKMFRSVFGTKEGKAVLAEIYRFCEVDKEAYRPGSFDQTAYNEGKQRVARYVQRLLNQDDEDMLRILQAQREQLTGVVNDGRGSIR